MTVLNMSSQVVFSRSPFELALGNFAVKAYVGSLMNRLVSLEIGVECKAFTTVAARVWFGVSFVMAAYNDQWTPYTAGMTEIFT
jgi:hypothetical protein